MSMMAVNMTPSSRHHRKKMVRFADSFGLDLAAVKIIMQEDLPSIPDSAFVHLNIPRKEWIPHGSVTSCVIRTTTNGLYKLLLDGFESPISLRQQSPVLVRSPVARYGTVRRIEKPIPSISHKSMPSWLSTTRSTLIPEFVEPFIKINFLDRVQSQNVCLENCRISIPRTVSGTISVTCYIRLVNRAYEKQVYVRYTTNYWSTFTDVVASYIPQSSDRWSDQFMATFGVKNLSAGQKVYVAVKYVTNGTEEFWDNNNGNNYSFIYRI